MARLSPVVFWQQSYQFLAAAEREFSANGSAVSIPSYFLVGRALELGLKSFLLLHGQTEADLRAVGHDLLDGLTAAQNFCLEASVDLEPEDLTAIRMLHPYYVSKDLEYVTNGYKQYPEKQFLLGFTHRLLEGIEPAIRSWRPTE